MAEYNIGCCVTNIFRTHDDDFTLYGRLPAELNSAMLLNIKRETTRKIERLQAKILELQAAIAAHRKETALADELFALQNPNA